MHAWRALLLVLVEVLKTDKADRVDRPSPPQRTLLPLTMPRPRGQAAVHLQRQSGLELRMCCTEGGRPTCAGRLGPPGCDCRVLPRFMQDALNNHEALAYRDMATQPGTADALSIPFLTQRHFRWVRPRVSLHGGRVREAARGDMPHFPHPTATDVASQLAMYLSDMLPR